MKIAQLLSQFLIQNKKLLLQGIGEFTLGNFYDNPFENEKGGSRLPENSISFKANPRVKEDPELIDYIAQHSGKIRPLASADLDSFLTTGRQLLNISKPFVIEGIGMLNRDAHNEIEFIQGQVPIHGAEEHGSKKHKSHQPEASDAVTFDDNYLKPARNYDNATRRYLIWGAAIVGIAVIGWIGYYFLSPGSGTKPQESILPVENNPAPTASPPDSSALAKTDSSQKRINDSIAATPHTTSVVPATYSYKIVIETAGKDRALKRYKDLIEWGHHVIMTTKDSITFKLAIPIKGPLSDSARNRDSLSEFFGRKTYVELN